MNDRVGHLFQGRYKAIGIEDDVGLARGVAYALGNPVRHGPSTMSTLPDYRWSGYGGLVGSRRLFAFESPSAVAAALGVERKQVARFVAREALAVAARDNALEPDQIDELNRVISR